ncbi:3-phosphoshikimate 1-carboxyvinyltransferase [Desulfoplanes formicivorans]|uniref:3-phosphoshikimate 1-carboxyvinyltransferase n=1 Tax=Desulfoplanes formicivorans TaxID=1592317 RepID=A0A194AEE2_9BACT|nr:3-phosphoshikimate 1-carboxyvinyltransferase [Desulfoplanes formicivorans]GAU08452.1 3-phosphoshikimate 1-carboxyvinyltransferase [Desulfoplanes formicivorans]
MQTISITAPASKSLSHRALICAALSTSEAVVENVLASDDLARTREGLAALGARFRLSHNAMHVQGVPTRHLPDDTVDLFVGESGTTCRLLAGVLAAFAGTFRMHGAGRMHDRPMTALIQALSQWGVSFTFEDKQGFLPLIARSPGTLGDTIAIDISESSQFLSALLLAAPCAPTSVTISLAGTKVVSWPYVALTLQVMEDFGVHVDVQTKTGNLWESVDWRSLRAVSPESVRFRVKPQQYVMDQNYHVEGDWSNASYFLAAGAVGSLPVRVHGIRPDSMQGDRAILDILQTMGAASVWDAHGCTVFPSRLTGTRVDMSFCPDIVPTVATAACFATGPTEIRGVAHLRFKESDRLQAVASQLRLAGQDVTILDDGLIIHPRPMQAGDMLSLASFSDHRIAMSLSLLECSGRRIVFDDPECVSKSFPDFWDLWARIPKGHVASS